MSSPVSAYIISPASERAKACEITASPDGVVISYVENRWIMKNNVKINLNDVMVSEPRSLTDFETSTLRQIASECGDSGAPSPGIDLIDKRSHKKLGTISALSDFKWVMAADMLRTK